MYQVVLDGSILHDLRFEDTVISNANLSLEVNKAGAFDFTIYPSNELYAQIKKLKSIVEVFQDNVLLFRGRVINDTMRFDKSKDIICEGDLAYFNDSIIRPYAFTGSIEDYLQMMIDSHNEQVEADKQFTLGNVTVTDPNDYIVRSNSNYVKTWEEINNKLIDNLGGYILVRRVSGVNYIDYLSDSPYMSTQHIELGENLLDVIKETRADDIVTALIPLGANLKDEEGNETDERLTIESVNGGVDFIHDADAVAKYGYIFDTITYDNVTLASNLLSKAQQDLAIRINLGVNVELKAIDLSMVKEPELWGRNLLYDLGRLSQTKNGVTLTVDNGAIILNGNCTGSVNFISTITIDGGEYTLSANNNQTEIGTRIDLYKATLGLIVASMANENAKQTKTLMGGRYELRIRVEGGKTYNNFKFYPKLEKGSIAHRWTPAPEDVPPIDEIRLFEYVQVTSKPHDIDTMALITKLSIDLLNPQNNTFTFGFNYQTFTDKQIQSDKVLKEIKADYVTNEKVSEVRNSITNLSSNIEQTAEQIRTEVSETYVSNGALDSYKSEVSTQFTQTSTDYTYLFNQLDTYIQTLDGDTQAQFIEIQKYIRFIDGNIELGDSTSQIKLVLENDIIKFVQNGVPVAYIDNNTLYITDGQFLNSLRIGNFAFTPRANGNLSFGKVV